VLEPVTVACEECSVELVGDSPYLRLNLTCDDEPLFYCVECWEGELGADADQAALDAEVSAGGRR
jgi:hypothetical protein